MRAAMRTVTFTLNGRPTTVEVEVRTLLTDALRHSLGQTGTHVGCEHGVCGACTVLVDGSAVRACLMLAVQVEGCAVETVESLGTIDELDTLQQSFRDHHGLQCGFCTPGILMSLTAAQREGLDLDETVEEVLGGHVCRCTGYQGIKDAIESHWAVQR